MKKTALSWLSLTTFIIFLAFVFSVFLDENSYEQVVGYIFFAPIFAILGILFASLSLFFKEPAKIRSLFFLALHILILLSVLWPFFW